MPSDRVSFAVDDDAGPGAAGRRAQSAMDVLAGGGGLPPHMPSFPPGRVRRPATALGVAGGTAGGPGGGGGPAAGGVSPGGLARLPSARRDAMRRQSSEGAKRGGDGGGGGGGGGGGVPPGSKALKSEVRARVRAWMGRVAGWGRVAWRRP
jgi:hypothetical protein